MPARFPLAKRRASLAAGAIVAAAALQLLVAPVASAQAVTITSPKAGATVAGSSVALSASVPSWTASVTWSVDGATIRTVTSAPWSATWNSTTVANGAHTVTANATSRSGHSASARVQFNVQNGTSAPTSTSAGPCGRTTTAPTAYQHVVWIVFENKGYSEVMGSSSAPYINQLAKNCGSATSMYAEAHPSLPNYIAMTSGSTQGITDDNGPSSHPLNVASIFSQLGSNWRALQESMPSNCDKSNSGSYAVRHNPAAYYTNLGTACTSQDVPLGSTPDISARFTFITPNLCDDMHDCSVATGDTWLSKQLPAILNSTQYASGSTALFITWDEDDSSAANHIPTVVVAPSVVPATASGTRFDHYAMLHTTEQMLGMSFLGQAATAPSMAPAFHLLP